MRMLTSCESFFSVSVALVVFGPSRSFQVVLSPDAFAKQCGNYLVRIHSLDRPAFVAFLGAWLFPGRNDEPSNEKVRRLHVTCEPVGTAFLSSNSLSVTVMNFFSFASEKWREPGNGISLDALGEVRSVARIVPFTSLSTFSFFKKTSAGERT